MTGKTIHPYFIKASNLIVIMVGLCLTQTFITRAYLTNGKAITIAILTVLFIAALAYWARQGKSWMKYLLLALTIVGIAFDPQALNHYMPDSIFAALGLAQVLLQIAATVLLFLVPKTSVNDSDQIIDTEV